jgi:hypothetical protein
MLVSKREGKIPFERPRRRWDEMLKWIINQRGQEGECGLDSACSTIESRHVFFSIR